MKTILSMSLLVVAGCGGRAATTASPQLERDVRLLDANDVALQAVVFAAAKHVFDPNAPQTLGFGGVFVNRRLETSLTADVRSYITRIGGFEETSSRPADCDQSMAVDPPSRSRPGTTGPTGGAPNPRAQPKRSNGAAICNSRVDAVVSFTTFRIASDTAYVELEMSGVMKGTKCLALTVDKDAGGWKPGEMKTSKISRCGA